jgi:thiamine-phosphate pyrophosphorylase
LLHETKFEGFAARADKLAAAALSLKRQSGVTAPFSLAFLTDQKRAPQALEIAGALPRGAAVILRDYRHKNRSTLAARLKSICAQRGVFLLIGADLALAEHIAADGVHFPSWYDGARNVPPGAIKTTACHNAADIGGVNEEEIDVVLLSPAFPTASHLGAPALGVENFRKLASKSPRQVLALGGVNENNADQLGGANVAGIAAIGAFLI